MINSASPETTPTPLDDYVAIQRLVNRYADAVVRRDEVQWGDCWVDDATWDLGRGRSAAGKPAIVEMWLAAMATLKSVVHVVHNGDAWSDDIESGCATGRWFIAEHYQRVTGDVGIVLAHYDDSYVRTRAGWLFSNRVLRVQYQGPPDLSGEFQNPSLAHFNADEQDA